MEDYALGFTYIKKWIKKEIIALVVELLREVEALAQVFYNLLQCLLPFSR